MSTTLDFFGRGAAPVRSVLYLQPRAGDAEALIEFYRREEVFERAMRQSGCLSCELQVATDGEGPVLVTALWESSAAYDGWVANPWREQNASALDALVEGGLGPGTRGQVYEVVLATGGSAGEADRASRA
jgi:heme-degrading monooxygenase HmoA